MAERFQLKYSRLFEIHLLHHYWLDDGAKVFDQIEESKRVRRLLPYDIRPFLDITPTEATKKAITSLGGIYRNTALGGFVAMPNHVVISPDTVYQFVITVRQAEMLNYTALTLSPQKIYEINHPAKGKPESKLYRFKANVPVLSNLTGASRNIEGKKKLFLSKEIPPLAPNDPVEALITDEANQLEQLISAQPNAKTQILHGSAESLPVFVHQGDVPVISPPAGLVGAPERGVQLSSKIPDHTFMLARLSAVRANDTDFSLVDSNGRVKIPTPVFQIRLKNRSTFWQYHHQQTGKPISGPSPVPSPLTFFGNAGTKQKAMPSLIKTEKDSTNKITKLVSEIFVYPNNE